MALHVMEEANRCLGCKKPRCREGCPIHTNIPEVIRLLKDGRLNDAGRMLFENNPLTTVCSIVCNHEKQCEGHCIRGIKDVPVHFSVIENYISTTYANQMVAGPAPSNGRKVAIIGAGPSGLTIAVILARYGYQVTIFDSKDKIGGVMRYGIPDFRLPDAVLDDFAYRHLELKGIRFRPNTTIGGAINLDDLFRDGYQSVFVGAGLWRPKTLHIKGETLGHVAFAINYLASPKAFRLGERVIVIGSGNSAMDCARTAIRNGAHYVTVFNRRDKIAASDYESSYAKLEGVEFEMMKSPVEIRDDGVVFAVFVSLGFAVWENISYVLHYGFTTALVRAVTAIPGHTCFGVFMGVFYGFARNLENQGLKREAKHCRVFSVVVPALLHGTYDYIASSGGSDWFFVAFIAVLFVVSYVLITKMSRKDRFI